MEYEARIMRIYRVEAPSGDGPYTHATYSRPRYWSRAYDVDPEMCPSYWCIDGDFGMHPSPEEDGLGVPSEDHYFGFETPEALREWFYIKENDAFLLDMQGMQVLVYEVPTQQIIMGHNQLMFIKAEATVVDRLTNQEFYHGDTEETDGY